MSSPNPQGRKVLLAASMVSMVLGLTCWSAPIEWSSLNVSAWSASGLSASCFRARADGSAARYAV